MLEFVLVIGGCAVVVALTFWADRRFNLYSPWHQQSCTKTDCRHHQIEEERRRWIAREIREAFDRAEFEAEMRRRYR